MSRAQPLFDYARELRRVPPGLPAHRGVPSYQLATVVRRLNVLADDLAPEFPLTAGTLRTTALKLMAAYGAAGLTGAECIELSTWLAMVGGHVTVLEPEADRPAQAGAA